jgi:glycosyltransferase involved in cell wall biosynthesis
MTTFSIITPSYNSARYLEETIRSIEMQSSDACSVEHIVMDGGSTDATAEICGRHANSLTFVQETDTGPANAINQGFTRSTGDILAWLNADDVYENGTLDRVAKVFADHPEAAFCFGNCCIVDEAGQEIRQGITRFKNAFFPFSSRFTFQSINYISQPAMFFRRTAFEQAGPLREDMQAAWDYEFILRLWHAGPGVVVPGAPLAAFRWHDQSISGQHFRKQFKEEFDAAVHDAGMFSLQALLHFGVRFGIVGIYSLMALLRKHNAKNVGFDA